MTRPILLLALLAPLWACRSAPSKYYTLVAPPGDPPAAAAELQIDVLPVDVPAGVDRAQIVVRRSGGEVTPVETRAWIAPLPLELRHALADDLVHALGARDVTGLTPKPGLPVYRIKLAVARFESELGKRALVDATWTVRTADSSGPPLTCTTRATERAASGWSALAEAHQRALAKIAAQIAAATRALATGSAAACPTD
ncbi:MAG TPA: PqiC family protein [Kofleriaceae bacterium]|jgi:hypothetical protein